jgi:hypothetical protein
MHMAMDVDGIISHAAHPCHTDILLKWRRAGSRQNRLVIFRPEGSSRIPELACFGLSQQTLPQIQKIFQISSIRFRIIEKWPSFS